jgi:hypothetical protein
VELEFRDSFLKDVKHIKEKRVKKKIAGVVTDARAASSLSDIRNLKKMEGSEYYYRIRIGVGITESASSCKRKLWCFFVVYIAKTFTATSHKSLHTFSISSPSQVFLECPTSTSSSSNSSSTYNSRIAFAMRGNTARRICSGFSRESFSV